MLACDGVFDVLSSSKARDFGGSSPPSMNRITHSKLNFLIRGESTKYILENLEISKHWHCLCIYCIYINSPLCDVDIYVSYAHLLQVAMCLGCSAAISNAKSE